MRIAVATDEVTATSDAIAGHLRSIGHDVLLLGQGEPWPDVGRSVGEAVASGVVDRGVVCCWTGTGVSIAANKIPGIRAALCGDAGTARGARRWNDANVVAIGLRLTPPVLAIEIIDAFLAGRPDAEEMATIARVEPPSDRGGAAG